MFFPTGKPDVGLLPWWKQTASPIIPSNCGFAAREIYGTSSSHRPDPASGRRLAELEPLAELGVRTERHARPALGGASRSYRFYGRDPLFTLLTAPFDTDRPSCKEFFMTIGMLFYALAAIVLFLGGIGSTLIPNTLTWGAFCIALGLLLDDYGFAGFRRR
jgi:hypothetical protein